MSIKLSAKLTSGMQITVERDTAIEVVRELAFFSELLSCCPKCQGDICFTRRLAKDATGQLNEYLGMICRTKGHQITFGMHKEGGLLFTKDNNWDIYKKDEGKPVETDNRPEPPEPDLPF